MKQYCRYCVFCFEADEFRCSAMPNGKELYMSEADIKRVNNCKYFSLSDMGDVVTGRQYKPRKAKSPALSEIELKPCPFCGDEAKINIHQIIFDAPTILDKEE